MTTDQHSFFIDGRWRSPASDRRITVIDASTEEVLGGVPEGQEADIDAAVSAARRAFDDPTGWSNWEPTARAEVMRRLADALDARKDELTRTVCRENGMPMALAEVLEGALPSLLLRYYADLICATPSEEHRDGLLGRPVIVRREPVGVAAAIVPWNAPQTLASLKYAPALAAGATVVLKPSPEAPLDSVFFAEALIEAGVPDGVINIVPAGREVGAYLVAHPGIDKVAFTGSTAAGRAVAETCGRLLRPATLELGGKSAAIVLEDADLDSEAMQQELFAATMMNNGQACFASTRVLAPRSRYAEVVDAVSSLAESLKVGDPLDPTTQVGPLATARQRDRVEAYIAKGKDEGSRLTVGGGRPGHLDRGWYVEPTVFADVDNRQVIAQEEIFGPVLVITPYEDEQDAIRLANDSDFGLGGSVWTRDAEHGRDIARRIRTGSIGVNHYMSDPIAPFGGVRASGLGREFGPEGLANYQQLKSIYL
ncbi:aldehyde dehydrogenase [Saccharopolyspora phatthalungensis]|uniref:Acyl-CoA reductase-like NAD-dependent aldehyde dehydrogenase n=1 Tax=Saccharopolyspora phatthalungensis TaxID=664693 RepID=A0A840QB24_9PSEU|nr:aldehyde dehydrogenase [Saccharopolyspora phatthalungensis]MBB5157010.1 acyl-CoA reductase-like NAD-dependent aldehyde dehydrogenase [Saccharopolyspora phatthalungensis]